MGFVVAERCSILLIGYLSDSVARYTLGFPQVVVVLPGGTLFPFFMYHFAFLNGAIHFHFQLLPSILHTFIQSCSLASSCSSRACRRLDHSDSTTPGLFCRPNPSFLLVEVWFHKLTLLSADLYNVPLVYSGLPENLSA